MPAITANGIDLRGADLRDVDLREEARASAARSRSQSKRSCIIAVAMRHFAENGYHAARVGDIAAELGIAKGSIFQHFGSKDGLFLEVYKHAVRTFPRYLNAPAEVRASGFFAVLYYWLVLAEEMLRRDWIPCRIKVLGNYGTDLALKTEINRFLLTEDPCGTMAFVRFGLERGELRNDLDLAMIASIVDWTMERYQDGLLTSILDQGVFRKTGEMPVNSEVRIRQFLGILQRALGAVSAATERGQTGLHQAASPARPKAVADKRRAS